MAQNIVSKNQRPIGQRSGRRRDVAQAAAPPPPAQWFTPERQYLTARDAEIRRVRQMATQALALVNSEKNFYDVSGSVNPVVNPTAQNLNGIPQGDDDGQRQGSSIRVKELELRLNFYSAAAATNSQVVRVFIVKDNYPNGSVPAIGLLFQGGIQSVNGMPALDTVQGRFKWIYDETFVLGTIAGGQDAKVITIKQKLDHQIEFIGSAAGNVGQGTMWLYVMADTVSGNASTGAYYSRIRYYDN